MLYEKFLPEAGYVIAETACGHGGDLNKLISLIDCAAESGAQIIKFQIFKTEERAITGQSDWDMFSHLELNQNQWRQAVNYARQHNLIIFADIFGKASFSLAKELKVDGFKIHSEDLLNNYFIARVAEENKILLIGVGGAHRIEIYNLVNFLKERDLLKNVVLMTGIQTYPTPIDAHSLGELSDLINKYSAQVAKIGFSDHISGDLKEAKILPIMALAKGACIIEKHITVNRSNKWTDYESALNREEFKEFIQIVNNLAPLLGDQGELNAYENEYRKLFKKTLVAGGDLKAGHVVVPEDIEFKKVSDLLSSFKSQKIKVPERSEAGKDHKVHVPLSSLSLVGKTLKNDVLKGEIFHLSDVKNKVGGIIVARCTSNRLPNKAILPIQGRESIVCLIDRMKRCRNLDCLILATSTDSSDDILVNIAQREGIFSFRGSPDNVSSRFYEAAKYYQLDHFVRITGDAILCDEVMVDKAIESHLHSCCDVTFMRNMPFGTSKEIISLNTIKVILDTTLIPSNTEYLEYYLENSRYFSVNYIDADYEFDPNLRITLDYEEDLELFNKIFEHFNREKPDFTLKDALEWLKERPEIAKINMHKKQKHQSIELNVKLRI